MRCDELMTSDVEIIGTRQTVREAAQRMRDRNVGFLPVCDDAQQLVGVLTDRDIALRVVAADRGSATAVEEVMTEELVTCRSGDDVEHAEKLMRVNQKARLICLDEAEHVAGVISLTDIVQYENECRAGKVVADVTEREAEIH